MVQRETGGDEILKGPNGLGIEGTEKTITTTQFKGVKSLVKKHL